MVKVFATILVNELVRLPSIDSIAVRMPTKAIIPNEIIRIVRMDLSFVARIEFIEIRKISPYRVKIRFMFLNISFSNLGISLNFLVH